MGAEARSPEEVFTPRSPPTREMFTRRAESDAQGHPALQDLVRETLREPGTQILLYGDAGVGKTTLLQYAAQDEGLGVHWAQCRSSQTFNGHVDTAISELIGRREVHRISGEASEREGEAGISKVFTVRGRRSRRMELTRQFDSVAQEPVRELAHALRECGRRLLVFDNFQNVDKGEVASFAQAAEILSDISAETGDVKMVILGVAEDASLLVGGSRSLRRRITEIEVPRMPDSEINEILVNGFSLLGLTPSGDAVARLIFFCDGFPYFAHLLGLNVVRNTKSAGNLEITREHVDGALARTARSVEASFDERIRRAFEQGGEFKPRRRVLELLAGSPTREWTAADVVAAQHAVSPGSATKDELLVSALSQLVKPEFGAVLRRSGTRGRFRYRFADPFLRPYLRMKYVDVPAGDRAALRESDLAFGVSRRTVTVVFCDITGTTSLTEKLDPEGVRMAFARYFDLARSVFERHGGVLEKFVGDAVMAVFGVPIVREDDALRAVRAAEELQAEMPALRRQLGAVGEAMELRIGVNTGEVAAGGGPEAPALVTGDTVNLAARLEQQAPPGGVLLGVGTYEVTRSFVAVEPARRLAIPGRREPVSAYALVSARRSDGQAQRLVSGPMVGRTRELAELAGSLDEVLAARRCRIATIVGAAGSGKTRLASELARVATDTRVLWGRCAPYGEDAAWQPLLELVRDGIGLTNAASAEEIGVGLRALFGTSSDPSEVARTVTAIMDVGAREKHEVLGAAQHVFELLARDQPLMAVVDNAQWAGPMFLDLIEHIAERSRDAPILICCLARPELLAEHPRFARRPPGRLIRLAALPEDQVGLLVRHLVGGDLEDETQRRIAESADGNPFFAAELVRMLRERGELVQRDGCWTLSAPTRPLQFPPTVTAIIEARLDRLPAHDRTVLERAAIVGTAFTAGAVAAIAPVELRNSVGESLDELLRTELIRTAKTTSREGTFRFAHALIRDTAYAGIPKQARAELHDQLGRWLQERSQTEELDVIAYHLEQAAQLRRELERPGSTDVPSLPEG